MTRNDLILEVKGLKTHFFTSEGVVKAVDGVDLTVHRGKTLCIVGESGCGKSITARSILQIVDRPGRIVHGQVLFHRQIEEDANVAHETIDLAALPADSRKMRAIRGRNIAMIFQEPMTSLSPVHTIGNQIREAISLHFAVSKEEAHARALENLRLVGFPRPDTAVNRYPFQLSGGMRQRAMIAMALACRPKLLIADEPTTALDVTTQAQILDLIRGLQQELGMALLMITHDLGVVAEMADDVAVMYLGIVAESGTVDQIFHAPKHPYTRALLQAIPRVGDQGDERLFAIRGTVPSPFNRPSGCPYHTRCDSFMPGICDQHDPPPVPFDENHEARCLLHTDLADPARIRPRADDRLATSGAREMAVPRHQPAATDDELLSVSDLRMHFEVRRGFLRRATDVVKAVDGVSFDLRRGETLGLVGESGCGKTTIGRCILRVYEPTSGQMNYRPRDGDVVDVAEVDGGRLKRLRSELRMVFQDPHSSLNARMTLRDIIAEPLRAHGIAQGSAVDEQVATLLRKVGLRPEYMRRYPHAFSGGERQRVSIARALATNPRLLVADEAVSALDVSVRAQIINLLKDLQRDMGLTYLFVSHDLSVVQHICDRVAVMYLGRIVELAETSAIFAAPQMPYTEALLSAVPIADPRLRASASRIMLEGEVPDPSNPPSGCPFHTRCRYVQDRCRIEPPRLREVKLGHLASCHFSEQLTLQGAATTSAAAD
ncbi:MAG: dipeptide ABC transporter ATP-binding protein [Thermomicrobiales bacterium]